MPRTSPPLGVSPVPEDPRRLAVERVASLRRYSKVEAEYKRPSANTFDNADRICAACAYFIRKEFSEREHGCQLVRGFIAPEYLCRLWKPRP